MAGQTHLSNEYGRYFSVPHLTDELLIVGQPMTRYVQFCDPDSKFGVHEHDFMHFDKQLNIDATAVGGSVIAEGQRIPSSQARVRQGTCTAQPAGMSILYTLEHETYAQIPVRGRVQTSLYNHSAKAHDYRAYAEFNDADFVYTPTGTDGDPEATWSTSGTAGAAATRDIQAFDLKNLCDALKEGVIGSTTLAGPAEPWDGNNFVWVTAVSGARALKDDPDFEKAAYYGDPDRIFNYEFGKCWDVRGVEDNHILRLLASGHKGAGFMFGKDTVKEITAIAEEIRVNLPDDFGRMNSLAWYSLKGFKKKWDFDATSENYGTIIKIAST